ncbi:BnaA05g13350D [Brassica napus]|uniref:BnaA05g13350D protein n=1 Tax=Brassica napus TaxID=3708 RepID=A0A078F5F2_BRANA|nr:BnaA05g13350D [Brassica napus]
MDKLLENHQVFRVSGYSGLYNGLGWLTLGRISGVGARFGVYEILTAFYKDGRHGNYVCASQRSSSGGDGGRCGRNIDDFSVRADQSSTTSDCCITGKWFHP